MGHIPYGYRIENGKAVIDEVAAIQVRSLYKNYLSGLSLANSAKKAGLKLLHSSAKRMLLNRRYMGGGFYPQIVDKEIFAAVEIELNRRTEKTNRNNCHKVKKIKVPPTVFRFGEITENYDNPIEQAEYLYSLIESEVI